MVDPRLGREPNMMIIGDYRPSFLCDAFFVEETEVVNRTEPR